MDCLQEIAPNSFPHFPFHQTRVSRGEKRAGGGRRNAAGRQKPPRRVVLKSARERPRRWIYPTALILLRRRFLVQIRPIFKRLFCVHAISPFAAEIRQKATPFSVLRLQKISQKNFWKGDDICHISCAIMRTWISYRTISIKRSCRAKRRILISITTPATPPIGPTVTWAARRMPSSR